MSFSTPSPKSSLASDRLRGAIVVLAGCIAFAPVAPERTQAATIWNGATGVNWDGAAEWNNGLPGPGNPGTIGSGQPIANSLLDASFTVESSGVLRIASGSQVASGLIDVRDEGRIEYHISTGGNTIQLSDGGRLGRLSSSSPTTVTTSDTIGIVSGASVFLRGASVTDRRYLILTGDISGDALTTVTRDVVNGGGEIRISPSSGSGNTSLHSKFIASGSGSARGILGAEGTLALGSGQGGDVEVLDGGILRLYTNSGVTTTGRVDVQSGGRIEVVGTSTGNTLRMRDGSSMGRYSGNSSPGVSVSNDTIQIDPGAAVDFTGANNVVNRFFDITGQITGNNVTITARNAGGSIRPIRWSSSTGNGLTGTLVVRGDEAALPGQLQLSGTNTIGTMNVEVQDFGRLDARTAGILDSRSLSVADEGRLAFIDSSNLATPSVQSNASLQGTGLVTSLNTAETDLRPLSLQNVDIGPGVSTGELTFEVASLSLSSDSQLTIEFDATSNDLFTVLGDLDLSGGPTLMLSALAPFDAGTYVIGSYSGALSGTFANVINNAGANFSINYGTGVNSLITVTFTIPEPASAGLLALGLLATVLGTARRRRR